MANRDIVVIGGSAGSLKPLSEILSILPADLNAAIFLVVHVPAGSSGIYGSVATGCPLPAVTAEDGMLVERAKVYIAPPDRHLLLVDGRLRLGNGPKENLARPSIDALFRSAALDAGSRAIGVILSGMLNDGASGLASIKRCGGMAIVQAPSTASSPDMPIAALEATPVDLSAGEKDLAAALIKFVGEQAGPTITALPELRLEVEIAAGDTSVTKTIEKLGHTVALTCPDCGGVLSEIGGEQPLRYRCQVGHAYTSQVLLTQQQGAVDEAMRVALRIIEERANLVDRMGRDADTSGRSNIADDYQRRAEDYRMQADVLRAALIQLMELKSLEHSEADIARCELEVAIDSGT